MLSAVPGQLSSVSQPFISTTSLPIFQREIQFALCPFRSLLLGVSQLFSLPAGTKMFQFPAYVCLSACPCGHVFALGNPRFKARMRLPEAYRSLPRPSSLQQPSYPSHSVFKIKSPLNSILEYIIVFAIGKQSNKLIC